MSSAARVAHMKMMLKACLAVALLGLAVGVLAAPTIELKDGSRIQGEILGVDNGVYTVRSPSIGTVHVAQSNIARIVYDGDSANGARVPGKSSARDDGSLTRDIQQLQTRLTQDPAMMQSIMSLQSDPQIQAILNDQAIVKAVQDGDYMSLLGNSKIQALESNEHLQQLLQQVH
jgi:ABC-type proline/glycine betaine transport system permease subunit